jgi:L-methionine (R)-S-oxide reductase
MFAATPSTSANGSEDFVATIDAILEGERDWLANMANFSAVLASELGDLNWAGFYLLKKGELVLGPFQGLPACIRIRLGKGVCGTAAEKAETIVVNDVDQFPGHIACDAKSKSEVVIPLVIKGQVFAVLDVDSPTLARFDAATVARLEKAVKILLAKTDWPSDF